MRQALVKYDDVEAGLLTETDQGEYTFKYFNSYCEQFPDQFITFNMPVTQQIYRSNRLFPFFDGLIPEGWLLNIATESWRINKNKGLICYQKKDYACAKKKLTAYLNSGNVLPDKRFINSIVKEIDKLNKK